MRAILFDKDGTLIDYWKTWLPIIARWRYVLRAVTKASRLSCCAPADRIRIRAV